MPTLPEKKVGLISCSGEDLPEGTVSRIATLKVLEELRPADTVTLCLPLFLAGEERERAFARFYPTIAIDGCDKRCAARATERYGATPAASLVITDLVAVQGLPRPRGVRRLDADGDRLAAVVADAVAAEVDRLFGRAPACCYGHPGAGHEQTAAATGDQVAATCSCGSGVPVGRIAVGGKTVDLVALPLIFEVLREAARTPGVSTDDELFDMVMTYNAISADERPTIRDAVLREYAAYWQQQVGPATVGQGEG